MNKGVNLRKVKIGDCTVLLKKRTPLTYGPIIVHMDHFDIWTNMDIYEPITSRPIFDASPEFQLRGIHSNNVK